MVLGNIAQRGRALVFAAQRGKAGDGLKERGLTSAISPQQRDGLTFVDGQGDIFHDGGGAIAAGGVGKL